MAKVDHRRTLFVGGLPTLISEESLWKHFSRFATLANVKIMKDKKTKEVKGYAYITLADAAHIPDVMAVDHVINQRKLDVQLATRKGERHIWKFDQIRRRLFLSGLPPDTQKSDLYHALSKFGPINNAYTIEDFETKKPKTYGYVEFENEESAQAALKEPVYVKGSLIRVSMPKEGKHQISALIKLSKDPLQVTPSEELTPTPSQMWKSLDLSINESDAAAYRNLNLDPLIFLNMSCTRLFGDLNQVDTDTVTKQSPPVFNRQSQDKSPSLTHGLIRKPKHSCSKTYSLGKIQRISYLISHALDERVFNYSFRLENPERFLKRYTGLQSPGVYSGSHINPSGNQEHQDRRFDLFSRPQRLEKMLVPGDHMAQFHPRF